MERHLAQSILFFATSQGLLDKTATFAFSHVTRVQHIYYIKTLALQTPELIHSLPCMCNSLEVRLHCSWTRILRHNRIIVLENFVTIWADFLQRETVFLQGVIGPPVCVGCKQPHSHQGSHRDSAESPGGHKLLQTATAVKRYSSKAPRADSSSQTLRRRHSATLTRATH